MKKIGKFIWKFFGILFFVENIFIAGCITGAAGTVYGCNKERKLREEFLNSMTGRPDERFEKYYKSSSTK